ncbi:hypothetical protein GcM1_194020 [Golovinomyces cichoracearum]|uniref:Dna-directed rna polymerase ii subunit rpb1 n=1 Tax=Golovinomyces cichoracearum TaxID=62708 RepID=A0A420J0J3_9PEZI|nr:hypothetical protein GcM1_194020 [Golovinomyces cichoracearum]
MNAHALLTSQGWRGTGNSLHPTSNAIGLSKPLLVGRKDDKNGLGKKKHHTSDMWWMQAFDQSLKSLETSDQGTALKSTASRGGLDAVRRGAGKWVLANGGLYANFIKGDGLAGSLNSSGSSKDQLIEEKAIKPKKKKSTKRVLKDTVSDVSRSKRVKKDSETKEERRARKLAKRLQRKKTTSTSTTEISSSGNLSKKKNKKTKESTEKKSERQ